MKKANCISLITSDQNTMYSICLSFAPWYHLSTLSHQTRNPYVNFKTLRTLPSESTEIEREEKKRHKKQAVVYVSNYKHMKARPM